MAAFTAGNIVVYRVGTGAAALGSAATAVFLDEYTPTGTLVQSIALPTAASGANDPLTASGSAGSEGLITDSADGRYLLLTGYDAAPGTSSITGTAAAADPRVVGRVDASGNVDTSTVLTGFGGGNNIRSVASADGTTLYVAGATGIAETTIDSTATPNTLATTNTRQIQIVNGQLYYSTGSGTTGVYALGSTPAPTTGTPTVTLLPGTGTATTNNGNTIGTSPYAFAFAKLSASSTGNDTLYVADSSKGIEKFSLVGGTWVSNGFIANASNGGTGDTGIVLSVAANGTVNIYVTDPTNIDSYSDTTGYNGTIPSGATTTKIAAASTNEAFRGIAFAPTATAAASAISIGDATFVEGTGGTQALTFTVTRTDTTGAYSFNYATADGTATAGTDYTAESGTLSFAAGGSATQTITIPIVNPNETTSEAFTVNLSNLVNTGTGSVSFSRATATGTIVPPVATISIGDMTFTEGSGGTQALTFTVTRSNTNGTFSLNYATADGTAKANTDYTPETGTLNFTAGGSATQTITVPIDMDPAAQPSEAFTVNLSNLVSTTGTASISKASATGTIVVPAATVSIGDVTFTENLGGTQALTFTVTRSNNSGAFSFNYATADGTAKAGTDYTTETGTLSFAAGGATTQTITVPLDGNANATPSENFTVNLSGLTTTTGTTSFSKASATGTILTPTPIYTIQGSGFTSPLVGQKVTTDGIVTALASNGYYLQDPNGDGNAATSDAIFVYTSSKPTVAVGDFETVSGTVQEYTPSSADPGAFSTTELASITATTKISSGNALPAAIIIGKDGILPPTSDLVAGNAFYESLEDMLVTIENPQAVGPTNTYGEIFTVADDGAEATGLNSNGDLLISEGTPDFGYTDSTGAGADFNPERIKIDSQLLSGAVPSVNLGTQFASVTGILNYDFDNFGISATAPLTVTKASTITPTVGTLGGDATHLTFASYNIENFSVSQGTAKFQAVASQILTNLDSPDVVALQEVQDNDGPTDDGVTSASVTLQTLVNTINAMGGAQYAYIDNPFIGNDTNGGEPGGNIRTAYLYRTDVANLSFVSGSLATIAANGSPIADQGTASADAAADSDQQTDSDNPFYASRPPLSAQFLFNGQAVTIVNNQWTAKLASDDLEGSIQPALNGGEVQRAAQAQAVDTYVKGILATNPNANVIVAGDLNEFNSEEPLQVLEGAATLTNYSVTGTDVTDATATYTPGGTPILTDLEGTLPAGQQYDYVYEGNAESLVHILSSNSLTSGAQFQAIHINSEYASQTSDHDPLLTSYTIVGTSSAPVLAAGSDSGRSASDNITNVATPTVTGSAAVGATVTLYDTDGATVLGSTTASSAGSYSITSTTLADGQHSLTVVDSVSGASGAASQALVVTIDTMAPIVTFTSNGGLTKLATQTVTGLVDVADAGSTVSLFEDGGTSTVATAVVAANGTFSASVTLGADGMHTLIASDTDTAGNTGTATQTYMLDTIAPTVSFTSKGGLVNKATQTVAGMVDVADAGSTVSIFEDGGTSAVATALVAANGVFSASVALGTDGTHSLIASDTDAAGNTGTTPSALAYTVDTTAPTVAFTSKGGLVNTATQTVLGMVDVADAGSTVSIFEDGGTTAIATAIVAANGVFSASVALGTDGTHVLTASDTDAAGNTGTTPSTLAYTVDTTAPTVAFTSKGGLVNTATQTVLGMVDVADAGSTVSVFEDGGTTAVATAIVGSNGVFSASVALGADGMHTLTASDTDAAGNTGTTPSTLAYTVDTTAPTVAFTSRGGATNQATQIVNGTVDVGDAGSTVSVFEDGATTAVATAVVAANGTFSATVALGTSGTHVLTASDTDAAGNKGAAAPLSYTLNTAAPTFTAGDLVISISGDGDGSGTYTDNQATPLVLQQITTSGAYVSQIVLPQTTTTNSAGTTESVISAEYGSSSEGILQLSADGHSLVIAGYGINAQTYNAGGAAVYGDARLAQSTSVPGGQYTPVTRVIADINANGTVDTSTALLNVDNTNNPRSVATVDGSSFYLSGQGKKGDTTQGLFYVKDGASTATGIDQSTDTRIATIYNGQLYVSRDSTQGTDNIAVYGATLPTTATSGTILTGISKAVTLTSATANTANTASIGSSVNLDPENFFFANATTLYVADGGVPKQGGAGDGGLQKWTYSGGVWTLQYTLSQGLGIVAGGASATAGTTGLIGLTGTVVGNSVQLYATNQTAGDLDQKYVFGITDQLAATTGAGESFSTLVTAAPDTNIRGIAFAPTPITPTVALAQDTGSSATDLITSNPTLVFTKAVAADTLVYEVDAATTFTATAPVFATNGSADGLHTVSVEEKDASGNLGPATSLTFTLDTTAPVVTASAASATVQATSASGAVETFTGSATDAVDGTDTVTYAEQVGTTLTAVTSGQTFAIGPHTIVASATDKAGNTGTSSFTFSVVDTTAPVVTASANAATVQATSANGAVETFTGSATDAVDGTDTVTYAEQVGTMLTPVTSGQTFAIGPHTIVASATDKAGNTGTSSFTFSVVDTTAPVVTASAASATVQATSANGAVETFTGSATDAVDGTDTVTYAEQVGTMLTPVTSGQTFAIGPHTIVASATDAHGNTGTATPFTFSVVDTTAPVVTASANAATVQATSANGAVETFSGSATDAVDGTDTVTYAEQVGTTLTAVTSGQTFAIGPHTIVASATDKAGNTGTSSFTFSVVDTTAPVVTASAASATVQATSSAGAVETFTGSATDAVDGTDTVTYAEQVGTTLTAVTSGQTFAIGPHTIVASATDKAGNTGTSSFTFSVVDTTAPVVTASAASATVQATSANGAVETFSGSATDAVDGTDTVTYAEQVGTTLTAVTSGQTFAIGPHTIVASATDKAGNTGTSSFTFSVVDTTAPVVTASAASATVQATSSAGAVETFTGSATDAVDGTDTVTYAEQVGTTLTAVTSGQTFAIGPHTIVASATDKAGNIGTSSFTFSVTAAGQSGVAEDGYIAGATVFADANGNGKLDPGEVSATTDANGNFTLVGGSGPLVLTGGTDITTKLAFTGTLQAPAGASVVSPLTTIVQAVATTQGLSAAAANASVTASLGLPAGTSLTTLDAETGAMAGNATATAVFAAQTQAANAFSLITGAGGNLASSGAQAAIASAFTTNTSVLTNATALAALAMSAGVTAADAAAVGDIGSASNAFIATTAASGSSAATTVATIAAAATVAQGAATTSLMQAVANPSTLAATTAAYTGNALLSATTQAGGTLTAPDITLSGIGGTITTVDPTISGTVDLADASGTVQIYENGTAVGTPVAVSAQGTFSTVLALPGDGTYVVVAEKANASGVVGTSNAVALTLNSTANETLFGTVTHDVTSAGGQIYALYETILGRAPDALGDEGWVAALNAGTPLTTIAQDFLSSSEYASDYGSSVQSNTAFIDQLYQDGLHRQPDPSGLQTWGSALSSGQLTRAQVAVDIATSPESQQDLAPTFQTGVFAPNATDSAIARLYQGLLDRAPEAGGLANWESFAQQGGSLTTIAADFIASAEYAGLHGTQSNSAFVAALYQGALGRGEDAGAANWVNALNGGASRASVALGIAESPEAVAHLAPAIESGFHIA